MNGALVHCHTAPDPVIPTPTPLPRHSRSFLSVLGIPFCGMQAAWQGSLLSQVPGVLVPSRCPANIQVEVREDCPLRGEVSVHEVPGPLAGTEDGQRGGRWV